MLQVPETVSLHAIRNCLESGRYAGLETAMELIPAAPLALPRQRQCPNPDSMTVLGIGAECTDTLQRLDSFWSRAFGQVDFRSCMSFLSWHNKRKELSLILFGGIGFFVFDS